MSYTPADPNFKVPDSALCRKFQDGDQPLGTDITDTNHCGVCGPANADASDCQRGVGPEYSWERASTSHCGFLNAGCRMVCRKKRFEGDLAYCCSGRRPPNYPCYTCDPKLSPTDALCSAPLEKYCAEGNNILTNDSCKLWASKNPDKAIVFARNYCTADKIKSDPACRAWVLDYGLGNADSAMTAFCKANPKDALCTCLESEMTCANKFDSKCVATGYKTQDMLNANCPAVMNCNQYNNLSPGAQLLVTVKQNCASNTTTGDNSVSDDSAAPSSADLPTIGGMSPVMIFVIFLAVVFVALIGALVVRVAMKK